MYFFSFSVDGNAIEGFGTVFDGGFDSGKFGNISTQAVLDLFKNAQPSDPDVVEIEFEEVEEFNIPRSDSEVPG